jgi:hypothetical protein
MVQGSRGSLKDPTLPVDLADDLTLAEIDHDVLDDAASVAEVDPQAKPTAPELERL